MHGFHSLFVGNHAGIHNTFLPAPGLHGNDVDNAGSVVKARAKVAQRGHDAWMPNLLTAIALARRTPLFAGEHRGDRHVLKFSL